MKVYAKPSSWSSEACSSTQACSNFASNVRAKVSSRWVTWLSWLSIWRPRSLKPFKQPHQARTGKPTARSSSSERLDPKTESTVSTWSPTLRNSRLAIKKFSKSSQWWSILQKPSASRTKLTHTASFRQPLHASWCNHRVVQYWVGRGQVKPTWLW